MRKILYAFLVCALAMNFIPLTPHMLAASVAGSSFINPVARETTVPQGFTAVRTAQDLDNIRNSLNNNYILMNDVDLSDWGDWTPIREITPEGRVLGFTGKLDGNGYEIRNMRIDADVTAASNSSIGLFGCDIDGGEIKNLAIEGGDVNVKHINYSAYAISISVGAFAGSISNGAIIDNCYFTGTIYVDFIGAGMGNYVAGIVGTAENNAHISNCFNMGDISIFASAVDEYSMASANAAGIVGWAQYSDITRCYNAGAIYTEGDDHSHAGGIVAMTGSGFFNNPGNIERYYIDNCYNIGAISATQVRSDYFWSAGGCAGGIVSYLGECDEAPYTVRHCYNAGDLSVDANPEVLSLGGIVAQVQESGSTISDCYYSNKAVQSIKNDVEAVLKDKALSPVTMIYKSSYAGFDFSSCWGMRPDANAGLPYLRAEGTQPDPDYEAEMPFSESEGIGGYMDFIRIRYPLYYFTDINEDAWYGVNGQGVIKLAYELGIVNGKGGATFDPYGDILISEVIKMAVEVHNIYNGGSGEFVQGAPWYQVYVEYALENGIIEDGDFARYDYPASRAQVAYIFANSVPISELTAMNTVASLPDIAEDSRYGPHVFSLYRSGVLVGNDAIGTFSPEKNITRAEACALISRIVLPAERREFYSY